MNIFRRAGILLGVVALTAACEPGARSDPAALEALGEEIMSADRDFARDVAERGIDAWVEVFTEDGAMLVPGREVRGPAAIREAMEGALGTEGYSLTWEPRYARVSDSGDLGYSIGRSRRTAGPDGAQVSEGAYVTIWRRGPDGRWRVELDPGVPDP